MNKKYFFIPLLVVIYFFVHFSLDYFYFLQPVQVLFSFLKYFFIIAAVFLAGYKIFSNKEKFILAFSSMLFIFLFFGSITDTAAKYKLINPVTNIYIKPVLIFLVIILLIGLVVVLINMALTRRFLLFWMIYCSVLTGFDISRFIILEKKEKKYLAPAAAITIPLMAAKPEIFFLVFDMYTSDSIYRRHFNYQNPLSDFLRKKEFYVTGNARALYYETYYSLASTLNLQPLQFYEDSSIEKYKKVLISIKSMRDPALVNALDRSGYEFRNYSVFNISNQQTQLQYNLNFHLANILTSNTFFNRIYNESEPDFLLAEKNLDLSFFKTTWSDKVKKDIYFLDSNFNQVLSSLSKNKSPGFNYFHYMIPHPPMLYDSNGNVNDVKDRYFFNDYDNAVKKYNSYTTFGNRKIMQMVNSIFQKAGKNVIIIIQGDHGFRGFNDKLPGEVRHGIINAVYLPNRNYSNFNDTMSPISTFKQIIYNQLGY